MEKPLEEIRDEEVQNETIQNEAAGSETTSAEEISDQDTASNQSSGTANTDSVKDDGEEKKPEEADAMKADTAKGDPASGESEKKGFFSKKKKEKDKRDQQIEELTDRVQRQMAEFDNFRKRSEKEKSAMFEVGAKSVLEKILPTVDNFERGFANLSEEQKQDAFAQGMEKVYRQLLTALEGIGVKPIEAVGQPFDPNFHNAVMHVEDEEAGENVVVEEFQKGYMYRDNVLRHSMVKVAN
ncbi:MAG: nucleotide exchange factor GrpE [Lachnospiraceae bacterium]|nr:nucleotide exchange factor GrpE [Lachnospiraceae bacterium]